MPTQHEIREQVTQRIISALEKDLLPWRRMWKGGNGGQHFNALTGKPYRGVNVLLLSIAAMEHGLQSDAWATFNQWKQMGCFIKRRPDDVLPGQWGTTLAVYIPITKKVEDPDNEDEDEEETFWMLRKFAVFNADQVLGAAAEQLQVVEQPDAAPSPEPDFEPAETTHPSDRSRDPLRRQQGLLQRGWRFHLPAAQGQLHRRWLLRDRPARTGPLERVPCWLGPGEEHLRTGGADCRNGFLLPHHRTGHPQHRSHRKPRRLRQELAPGNERRPQLHLQGQQASVEGVRLPVWVSCNRVRRRSRITIFLYTRMMQ